MLASAAFNAEHNGELALTDTATGLAAALLQCPTAGAEVTPKVNLLAALFVRSHGSS